MAITQEQVNRSGCATHGKYSKTPCEVVQWGPDTCDILFTVNQSTGLRGKTTVATNSLSSVHHETDDRLTESVEDNERRWLNKPIRFAYPRSGDPVFRNGIVTRIWNATNGKRCLCIYALDNGEPEPNRQDKTFHLQTMLECSDPTVDWDIF